MTKREIMIENLIKAERKRYEKLSDDELIARVGAFLSCEYCPICGELCDRFPGNTCSQSIKAWYNEGGNNGNNNP